MITEFQANLPDEFPVAIILDTVVSVCCPLMVPEDFLWTRSDSDVIRSDEGTIWKKRIQQQSIVLVCVFVFAFSSQGTAVVSANTI